MGNLNLRDILIELRSEKIKNRQDGLAALRNWFNSEKAISTLDVPGDGKAWLVVFQALFTAITLEKKALLGKKGSATAERRLSDVASFMRSLTERSVDRMNKKVVKALITHFTQMIVHEGKLLSHISLDYAKAIRSILEWPSHLDHLDETLWLFLVELGFNVVLEDHPRKSLKEQDEAEDEDVEDSDAADEDEVMTEIESPKKRRFPSSTPAPRSTLSREPSHKARRTVTQEQTEFMSVLVILFRSTSAPILSPNHDYLPNAILSRLQRFVRMYPSETSLHHDFLLALHALATTLCINCTQLVIPFTHEVWQDLIGTLSSKTKGNRETAISVLISLFPFYIAAEDTEADPTDLAKGVSDLATALEEVLESRRGVDCLDMEQLRLGVQDYSANTESVKVFASTTFSAGSGFDSSHALTWATMMLHADCIAYLERYAPRAGMAFTRPLKRTKTLGPIASLMQGINDSSGPPKIYRMQVLLFLIDRHWSALGNDSRQAVISSLTQCLSTEDGDVQNATFACLAAAGWNRSDATPADTSVWDQIWVNAVRRMSNAAVCRAACHCAWVLLKHYKYVLSSTKILQEIEMLASDLDVHGPPGLQDAVCAFFAELLLFAHGDVRLYGLKIEDKVLAWLSDVWRNPAEARARGRGRNLGPSYHVPSSLDLLESVCGLQVRAGLPEVIVTPNCHVANTLEEYHQTTVIRDFLLHACLPTPPEASAPDTGISTTFALDSKSFMVASSARERRTSALLLRALETAQDELEDRRDHRDIVAHMPADEARRYLNLAVMALAFSTSLLRNDLRPNRRVLQLSCKIVARLIKAIPTSSWSADEKAYIVQAIAPLVMVYPDADHVPWQSMVSPGSNTGIRHDTSAHIEISQPLSPSALVAQDIDRRRPIWLDPDVQYGFEPITHTMKGVLRSFMGESTFGGSQEKDPDFATAFMSQETHKDVSGSPEWRRHFVHIAFTMLSFIPCAQSNTREPARNDDLCEIILSCKDEDFVAYAHIYFCALRHQMLNASSAQLGQFLRRFEDLLVSYAYSHAERLQVLAVNFLDSTMHLWLQATVALSEAGSQTRELCHWLAGLLSSGKARSWRVRDRICRFLDRYLSHDMYQQFWTPPVSSQEEEVPQENNPGFVLPTLGGDEDIRVRFRVATINPRLLATAQTMGQNPSDWYDSVSEFLSTDLDDFEHILTRFLCLGNIMIASSTIRHAPYWHLIEIDFHSSRYSRHLLAVLTNVSQRMGLQRYSELFEAYASQIGFSIRQAKQESLRLSPELVGYPTRKAYSEASFASFSPVYLSTEGSSADALHGRNLFINHCKAMDISGTEGILRCFGVIVGRIVVAWTDRNLDQEDPSDGAEKLIATTLGAFDLKGLIKEHLDQYGDEIITAILRALGEQDFQEDGPIITAIRRVGDMESCWSRDASSVFQRLCRYRRINDFGVHEPTKPAFGSRTILLALAWAKQRTQAGEVSTTYHILHQLFADMQNMRLVNEQLRILNALTLWVSCHHEQFTDLTLLETLLVGGTRIMSHVELATGAQSLLSWAFELYRQVETVLPAFPHVLLSISGIIHSYCSSVEKATKEKGDILIQWVHGELLQLCQEHDIKEQILQKVLPAWPFELDKDLSVMLELLPRHIAEILEDSRLTANMFHVVRSMRALAEEDPDYANQFSKSDFWRLKDSIPPANQLQVQDVHSLAELLVRVQGQIVSNPIFNHNSQSIRFRHLQISKVEKESRAQTVASLTHKPIVSFLRSKLSDPSGKMARSTYDTIRHLISVVRPSDENFNTWASEHRQELCYLSAFPRHSSASSPAQLNDLKEKTDYLTTISDFDSWVTKLAGLLCNVVASEDPFFTSLVPYVNHQPSVAEDILPVLIHAILLSHYHGKEKSKTRVVLSEYLTSVVQADAACEATIQAVVDIVMHLRYFNIPNSSHPLSYNLWLEMDFTVLVRAALRCGAYTTALLFLELRAEHNEGSKDQGGLEDIYYDVYSHIDEPDGFYGVQSNDLQQFLFRRFQHENEWDKAFRFYGASVEAQPANVTSTHGAITSLHSFGFHRLAMIMSNQGISSGLGAPMSADLSYELGWRTGIWDLPDVSERNCSSSALYSALRAVHRDTSISSIDSIVESSLKAEVEQLRLLGSENLLGIRGVLRNIMCLRQVAEWQQAKHATLDLHIPWHARDSVMSGTQFKFGDFEVIMATRTTLLRSARQQAQKTEIGDMISPIGQRFLTSERDMLLRVAQEARRSDQAQVALNAVTRAQALESSGAHSLVIQEFSSVLWSLHEQKPAIQSLKPLACAKEDTQMEADLERAIVLARLGEWSSHAGLEKPVDILNNYFAVAAATLDTQNPEDIRSHAEVYYQYAIFAERQYQDILKSPDTLRYKIYKDRKYQEYKKRQQTVANAGGPGRVSRSNPDMVALKKSKEGYEEDERRYKEQTQTLVLFRGRAIEMFSRCMAVCDLYDDESIMRLISIWFSHFEESELYGKLEDAIARVPSHKFVFLAHQLSARLAVVDEILPTQDTPTQQAKVATTRTGQLLLRSLILRMCREHPFHSLYQVYCLRPARKHSGSQRRQSGRAEPGELREAAAEEIFSLLREDTACTHRVLAVEQLCDASLQWAQHPIKKEHEGKRPGVLRVPDKMLISKIRDLAAPVTTAHTPLDPTTKYSDCVWVSMYEQTYTTAGGINLPKISKCIGSDGVRYKQLFKGEGSDDMRQDAVMEQVFDIVDRILVRNLETKRRNLRVRGYKVIPLAPRAGLLEFVNNTAPLLPLVTSAHNRYNPGDRTTKDADSIMRKFSGKERPAPEIILDGFLKLRERFHPAMRHIFTERHKSPSGWFAMRLAYTRSVATTSIVGHIIGLGDRHMSNILMDNATGELIHIDLGIAFDQGKALPIPELVPFRLTADIVDGMGVSGTQGVFQRCAEETLRVLRKGSTTIMTVLEVFRHDPLQTWTVNRETVQKVQGTETVTPGLGTVKGVLGIDMKSDAVQEAADRALSGVARKLSSHLSVEHTISELITEAMEPTNLAYMFAGWGQHY